MSDFLFERDFDQELEAEGYVAPAPQEVHYSKAQLAEAIAAARAEAFAEGEAAGRQAAEAELRESLLADQVKVLTELRQELALLLERQGAARRQLEFDLGALCLFLAQNLVPEYLTAFGPRRIRAFARQVVAMAEGDLEITLAPELSQIIAQDLAELPRAKGAGLKVLADPALGRAELRAQWAGGGAEYNYQHMLEAMLATFTTITREDAPSGTGS